MGYTSAQGNTAYVSDAMPAASLNLYTSNDFDFDPACFTELNMLNLELARRDLDAARERVAAMGCADAPAGKVALATVLLGAGQPEWARRTVEEATAPAWIERISPLDDQALADRYMLHKLLGMPDAALADAMELQRRQARKSGRPDPDYANSVAYYLADFPDYLPQAEAQARRSIRAAGLRPYNQATLGWIRFLRGDAAGGLDMLKRGYAAQPRDEEMVADYGLALWRDGQQALARRIWDQAEAQCVWGRRLYDALRAVDYPHPLFHASGSAQVQAYQQRCAQPGRPATNAIRAARPPEANRASDPGPGSSAGRACPAQAAASSVRSTGSAAIAARQAASTFSGGMLLMPAPTTSGTTSTAPGRCQNHSGLDSLNTPT